MFVVCRILRIHWCGDRSSVGQRNAWLNSQRRLEDRKKTTRLKHNFERSFSCLRQLFCRGQLVTNLDSVNLLGIVPGRLKTSWSSTIWNSGPSTWPSHWLPCMATVNNRHHTQHGWLCVITHCRQKVSCTGFRGQATEIRTLRAKWPRKIPMCGLLPTYFVVGFHVSSKSLTIVQSHSESFNIIHCHSKRFKNYTNVFNILWIWMTEVCGFACLEDSELSWRPTSCHSWSWVSHSHCRLAVERSKEKLHRPARDFTMARRSGCWTEALVRPWHQWKWFLSCIILL